MNPSFQRDVAVSTTPRRPETGMNTSRIRHQPATTLQFSGVPDTASIFFGKMFDESDEKSWQRRARFSDSDRTCGRKQSRCE